MVRTTWAGSACGAWAKSALFTADSNTAYSVKAPMSFWLFYL